MVGFAPVFLLGVHDTRRGAARYQRLVFDPDFAILHELAAALRGVGLARGTLLGLGGFVAAARIAGRGLAFAQSLKRLPECRFVYFFSVGILVFFLREGKKIVIR
ncbi:hypothetical protein AA0614_1576 [Komagataeibacter saccharivorans NRIC 0614]|nr:hypothetical protein AA0614_1576 [Komagataeibacter saccharivorans NRIC 0614]